MATKIEFEVVGVRPGKTKSEVVAGYDKERWQFAIKLIRFLKDRKWSDVKIVYVKD